MLSVDLGEKALPVQVIQPTGLEFLPVRATAYGEVADV
ncbi:hypothetical protein BH11MYX1_BH11MYX1_33430 [soil metagenome]